MILGLVLPAGGGDPPTSAVVNELNAVDAALDDWTVLLIATFVGAEDVGDVAEALGDTMELALEKPALHESVVGRVYEFLMSQSMEGRSALTVEAHDVEPNLGPIETAVACPLPRLASGSGNDFVESANDRVDGSDVLRVGRYGRDFDASLCQRRRGHLSRLG